MGFNDFLRSLRYKRKIEKFSKEIGLFYSNETKIKCENQIIPEKKYCTIAFIIPEMSKHSGGHTGILRLGTYLYEMGHDVHYIAINNVTKETMERNASINFPSWKGTFHEHSKLGKNYYDIGVATKWNTCYHLLSHQSKFGLKAYFIQDFEPFFYAMSDHYLLSLNTYKMGFKMISLGPWNANMINKFLPHEIVNYIEFPVELEIYDLKPRKININNQVKLAVYLKRDPKRAPFLLLEHLKYLQYRMQKENISLDINIFGIEKNISLPVGNNLGKLNTEQLRILYEQSHFGIVASLTNISYVNYEMIASGLPVIDFIDGSAPSFFSSEEMIFIESHPMDLYNKVKFFMINQDKLNNLLNRAQVKLKSITWRSQAERFANILFSKD